MQDIKLLHKRVNDLLLQSVHTLIIIHQMPDSDCIGSAVALSRYLDKVGKRHRIFCKHLPGKQFHFLDGVEKITNDVGVFNDKRFTNILVLDSSDLYYAGVNEYLQNIDYSPAPKTINIDHHITNGHFADINIVAPEFSSTTQILYDFFMTNGISIDKEMATALLAGIIGDTDGFSNPATTFSSLEAASQLLLLGARYHKVNDNNFKNKSIDTLKLWGKVLSRLKVNKELEVAYTYITKDDAQIAHPLGITNFLNNLTGIKAVLVLKELPDGRIKGSLRTTQDNVDVSSIASLFGGGGHKKAAGFSIPGRLVIEGDNLSIV